eukprot:jgi/Botrbrau1/1364/Bobra.0063s0073.1
MLHSCVVLESEEDVKRLQQAQPMLGTDARVIISPEKIGNFVKPEQPAIYSISDGRMVDICFAGGAMVVNGSLNAELYGLSVHPTGHPHRQGGATSRVRPAVPHAGGPGESSTRSSGRSLSAGGRGAHGGVPGPAPEEKGYLTRPEGGRSQKEACRVPDAPAAPAPSSAGSRNVDDIVRRGCQLKR